LSIDPQTLVLQPIRLTSVVFYLAGYQTLFAGEKMGKLSADNC
jgi:hypothetical protein